MTTLTMQDEKRIETIQRVYRGELTMRQGSSAAGDQRAAVLPHQAAGQSGGAQGCDLTAIEVDRVNARLRRRPLRELWN